MRRKLKRISENVRKFMVPVGFVMTRLKSTNASAVPRIPPARQSTSASRTKESSTDRRENPIARSVPISRVRAETCAYIVFIAPKEAPIAVITPTRIARTLMGAPVTICSSKYFFSVLPSNFRRWSPLTASM